MKKTAQTLLAVMAGVLIGSGVSFVREGLASRGAPPQAAKSEVSPHDLLEEVKARVSTEGVLPDGAGLVVAGECGIGHGDWSSTVDRPILSGFPVSAAEKFLTH